MSDKITLSTLDEALEYLQKIVNDDHTVPNIQRFEFAGELSEIRFKIDGDRYNGTVPGTLARGLWEFQQEIYRAVAFCTTGYDNIGRISGSLEPYTLNFKVSEGSTSLLAHTKELAKALQEGFISMNSRHKAIVLIFAIAALATSIPIYMLKSQQISLDAELELERERTKQMELIAGLAANNSHAQRWLDAGENGVKAIVKSAPDAQSIKYGEAVLTQGDIQEINSRSSRETPKTEPIHEAFRIIGFKRQGDEGLSRFTLGSEHGEFNAILDEENFPREKIDKFWRAAQHNQPIELEVQVNKVGDEIRGAFVTDIPLQPSMD